MVTVYKIFGGYEFQYLEPLNVEEYLAYRREQEVEFNGRRIDNQKWKPPELYIREPVLDKPDIWNFPLHTFAFNEEAYDILHVPFDQSCQLLPFTFQGKKMFVINVTYVIDCLDRAKSQFNGTIIREYAFHRERLDNSLFKIPETRYGEILTVEGIDDPDNEFKPLVEKHGLKGLHFRKLWSDED